LRETQELTTDRERLKFKTSEEAKYIKDDANRKKGQPRASGPEGKGYKKKCETNLVRIGLKKKGGGLGGRNVRRLAGEEEEVDREKGGGN